MPRLSGFSNLINAAIMVASVSSPLASGSDMSVLEKNPFFVLSVDSAKVRAFVEVNGFYVYTIKNQSGSSKVELPVNHYFTPDRNTIGIKILRDIDIPSNLPGWGFLGGEDLPNYYQISEDQYYKDRNALFEIYKSIEQSLYKGDVDSVLDLFEERNNETDQAFYMEPGETREGLKRSLQRSIENDKIELLISDETAFILKPEPGQKLVSLVRSDKRGAIAFNFIGEEGSVRYDLVFRKEDGEWIISR